MPKSNHLEPVGTRNVMNILVIVIVTVAVTILCIKFGRSMAHTSDDTIIRHTHESVRAARDEGVVHVENITDLNVIYDSIDHEKIGSTVYDLMVTELQPTENYSSVDRPKAISNESPNADQYGNYFKAPPNNFPEIPMKKNWYTTDYRNHNNVADDGKVRNTPPDDIGTQVLQNINRIINNYDYWKKKTTSKSITKDDNKSTDSIDLSNNMDNNNRRHNHHTDIMLSETGLNRIDKLKIKPYFSSIYDHGHSSKIKYHKPLNSNFQLPRKPTKKYSYFNPQKNIVELKKHSIDWQLISIMILIKFGLFKLKMFGILKILFLFLLKLKLFIIKVYFKFHLLNKLKKLLKILTFLLLLLPLLPLLTALISPMVLSAIVSSLRQLQGMLARPTMVSNSSTNLPSTTNQSII